MPVGGMGDGFGGNSFVWIFGLLILLGLFNGGFGGFGGNSNAVQADVNRGFDNQNLQAQTRDILSAVTSGTAQSVAASNQVYHDVVGYVGDKYSELTRDISGLAVGQANLLAKENECCCATLRAIDGVNYNAAMSTAAINANTTAQTQKILDAITGNRMADMQSRINALELQQAVAGVVRYPMASTYSSGCNPFCGCSCGA
jgi:hypothetical protein